MADTVLITGGTSGIGLALAKRYQKDGNTVLIVGRNTEKLQKTVEENPGLLPILADVSLEEDRIRLFETVARDYPEVNIVINNAGIQQRTDLMQLDWAFWKKEIDTNFDAPIHLCGLFAPFLAGKPHAVLVNVSSGLAFRPPVHVPIYGATKAGLHSFTYTLREQLQPHGIQVIEIIPPAVNTNLGGPGVHARAADLDAFADSVYQDLLQGKEEIGYLYTQQMAGKTRRELEAGWGGRSPERSKAD